MKTIIKKQGTLQGLDYLKGIGIGAATAALWAVWEFVQAWLADGGDLFGADYGSLGKELVRAFVAGLVAYLGKNFVEPTTVVHVQKGDEAKETIREGV